MAFVRGYSLSDARDALRRTFLLTQAVSPMRFATAQKFSGTKYPSRLMVVCASIALIGGVGPRAHAVAPAATTTTLAITAGGKAVTSVTSGTAVTLTATVTAGSTKVTTGLVSFCDASVSYCTDLHLIGTAQLTGAGTATLSTLAPVGSHSYKAVFAGTKTDAGSDSSASALAVTGLLPSVTAIASISGYEPPYSLAATVGGAGSAAPTGPVSLLNASAGNAVLGTGSLGAGTAGLEFLNSQGQYTLSDGAYPQDFVAAGDFNGDGFLDVAGAVPAIATAGATYVPGHAFVMLGDGKGGFGAPGKTADTGFALYATPIVAGDLNGDGKLDAVAEILEGDPDSLVVLLGNGDGTFTTGQTYTSTDTLGNYVIADLDGDGIPDIAVIDRTSDLILLYVGNGDGTFTASSAAPASTYGTPWDIATGDFNGDGLADLAVATSAQNGPGAVTILLSNGDGTFTKASAPAVGVFPESLVVGDFNRDGKLDLAAANESDGTVTVLVGHGDGTFTEATGSPMTVSLGSAYNGGPPLLLKGDFNGDGKLDIAVGGLTDTNGNAMLLGNGDGTFAVSTPPLVNTSFADGGYTNADYVAVGDFNGDGLSDFAGTATAELAATQTASVTVGGIAVVPGTGTQSVIASYAGDSSFASSQSGPESLNAAPVTPTVTVTASPNAVVQGTSVTLTATVTGSGTAPTGSVTFYSGSASLGTGTLNGSGVATYSTDKLPVGADAITASYGGDNDNSTANSAPVTVTVTQAALDASIPNPPAVNAGSTATATATFTASAAYAGTLNLNCSLTASPTGAQSVPACSLAPTSLTLAAGATGTSALSVTTTAASTTASIARSAGRSLWELGGGGPVLAVLLLCGVPARRRRWLAMLMLLWVVVASAAVGCGGGGGTKGTTTPATTAGNYTFTVTGTDAKQSTVTTSATVVVTVN
jgi:hypothetical protein